MAVFFYGEMPSKPKELPNLGTKEVSKLADTDFFDKPEEKVEEKTEETQEPEKVKIGEKEYTQEELSKLVGLGEIGREAEEKYNVKLDKVWPNLQSTINEKKTLEQEIENLKQAKVKEKIDENAPLTPEEIAKQARVEAKNLGLISVDDVNEYIDRRMEAREVREDTQAVVTEAEEKFGIKTDEEAILNHMVETGIRNPEKAFKDLYEEKIDAWKEQQLDKIKKPGMVTDSTSTAGAKEPESKPVTKDNFFARMDAVLDKQS